jgi:competence protein ComEC
MTMNLRAILIFSILTLMTLGGLFQEMKYVQDANNSSKLISLSVENGDATLIQSHGTVILIDTGTSDDVVESVRRHLGFFERTIDILILTHPDRDHIGGTLGILQAYEVKNIILTGAHEPEDILYQEILQEIKSQQIPITLGVLGTSIQDTHIDLDIIWPLENIWGQEVKDANYHSIVLQGRVGNTDLLLTGDIDILAEQQLIRTGLLEDTDILKVGHHGSKTSTHPIFLDTINPETSIISAGKDNPFGHPHDIVIDNLQESGTIIRQTAEEGDIEIEL